MRPKNLKPKPGEKEGSPAEETTEQFAFRVVAKLRKAGFSAFYAGGCVRDSLLGIHPKDYDVATDALPEQVRETFGRRRTLAIGQSFGVIAVLGPKRQQVEVATFRSDGQYSDGRHPDSVTFSSPEADAARRDFTINGMFYDPLEERVIDYVNGQADLQAKLVRAIGNPHHRIEEDRLRMLRAVRIAATYEFEIESETLSAIQHQHAKLSLVSQERITQELQRMLCQPHRQRALILLRKSRLLEQAIPELESTAQDDSRWHRLLAIVDTLVAPTFALVLSALMGKAGAALPRSGVSGACRRLKVSNEVRKSVEWIVTHQSELEQADTLPFSSLQPLLIHHDVTAALSLIEAVARTDNSTLSAVEHCRERLAWPASKLNPSPLIRGQDLSDLGIPPGPVFAKMLAMVRAAQLDKLVSSRAEALELVRCEL